MQITVRAALAAIALSIIGCDSPTREPPPARIAEIAFDSSAGPIFRTAVIRLTQPAGVTVTYGAPGTPVLTISSTDAALEHRVLLPRLRAERSYHVEAAPIGSGSADVTAAAFTTGALPPKVAALTFTSTGTPTHLVALVETVGGTGLLGLITVENNEVVGYIPSQGSLFGTTRRASGDLVLLDPSLGLVSYRPDGTLMHRLPQPDSAPGAPYGRIHHDVIATPQDRLLFIANETATVNGETVTGEALWEWTPETGTVTRKWSAFQHLDWATQKGPRSSPSNWLHGNSLAYGSRGNVLLSMRNMDQVLSIAPDFSRVEWRLGGEGATLALTNDEGFHGQHSVSEPAPGRLLLFDNGFDRAGSYSRAIEYSIDTAAGTATRVWQYRPTPDIYAALVGSVKRLDNGNTVILFGMQEGDADSSGPLTTVEVDAAGAVQWRLDPGPGMSRLYRVTPVSSILGETSGSFRE